MDLPQELDRMHQILKDMGMKIEKTDLQSLLLRPGEERRQLIEWALSELGVTVDSENDIASDVILMGLCSPGRPDIVQGKCSAQDSLKFWKRLFHMVQLHKGTDSERAMSNSKNNCEFWQRFCKSSELKDLMEQKQKLKKKQQTPKNVNSSPKDSELLGKLAAQRLALRKELQEMEKQSTENSAEELISNTDVSKKVAEQEVDDVKVLASQFEHKLQTLWMPWMSDEVKEPHREEFSEVIQEISERVRKLKLLRENAQKIVTVVENIKNVEIGELNIRDLKL